MPSSIPHVDVAELAEVMASGHTVVDVRQPEEYVNGHVPGAVLLPLQDLPDRVDDLPADRPLHLICRSGARSLAAAEYLADQGLEAVNVAGGMLAWIDSGRPVVTGSSPS